MKEMLFLSSLCNLWYNLAVGSEKQKSSRRNSKQVASTGSGATIWELLREKIYSAVTDILVC